MDDNMEDDIISEVFTVHLHLMWKVISMTSSNLDYVLLQRSEGHKYKLSNAGLILLFTLILVCGAFLQAKNNWVKNTFCFLNKIFCQTVIVDCNIKNLVASSTISGNITHELAEGIVGVYALQGRRGTMEDKYSVMQEVDVGGSNKLSLFGVYDGHGGQFVAEYVKQHLFTNTVHKIRELRSTSRGKNHAIKEAGEKSNNKLLKNNEKTSNSLSNSIPKVENANDDPDKIFESNSKLENCIKKIEENEEKQESIFACKVEEVKEDQTKCESKDNNGEISLKKEDPYMNIKLRKKSSASMISDLSVAKEIESKREVLDDSSYMDVNSNVNYTKLLNDQIMDIDEKVVSFCKSKTDLSGTTAVIAVLDGELLIIGNVGDSRAVMGDLKGSTIQLSFDHKPNQLKERRRIKEAGGFITFTGVWRVAGILATSRALGDFPLKDPRKLITAEPDVLTFSLKDHKAHFVILATDGLWDVMSNEEAVDFVRKHISEWDNGARSLVLHAYERGSQDNITAMIINLSKLKL